MTELPDREQQIVTAHGGKIWAENRAGAAPRRRGAGSRKRGARFVIRLPAATVKRA